jgi:hypothetical protein
MVYWLVDIKQKDLRLILLHDPILSKIGNTSTVDKKEKFNSVVSSAIFYTRAEL